MKNCLLPSGFTLLINERIDTKTADRVQAALPRFPGASGVQRLRPVSEADLRQAEHYLAPRVAAHRD